VAAQLAASQEGLSSVSKGMDSMVLARDRDQWKAVVNTVMNLRLPLNAVTEQSSVSRTAGMQFRRQSRILGV
jgi:hypothetical protein